MAMLDQWASFAGTEIFNLARTQAYMAAGITPAQWSPVDCVCDTLQGALGDDEYVSPFMDPAPWADDAYPESYGFAGFIVDSVEGLDGAPFTRTVTESPSGGGTLGRLRMRPRNIIVSAWAIGLSCCSVNYGVKWLAAALRGNVCGTGGSCRGDSLCFFDCCPEPCGYEVDENGHLVIDAETGDAISNCLFDCTYDAQIRTMCDVGLTDGPHVVERINPGCGCGGCGIARVEFTLTAGNPWLYTQLQEILCDQGFDQTTSGDDCTVEFIDCSDPSYDDPCVVDDCLEDPLCPIPVPPELPVIFNPCLTGAAGGCIVVNPTRFCASLSSSELLVPGDWMQAVPYIEVKAGSREARNIQIRFYENPMDLPCDDVVKDNCNACASIGISYIPAGGTLIIDGRCCEVLIKCGAISKNGLRNVYSPDDNGPFRCPTVECVSLCVCIEGDLDELAEDASIGVWVAKREP